MPAHYTNSLDHPSIPVQQNAICSIMQYLIMPFHCSFAGANLHASAIVCMFVNFVGARCCFDTVSGGALLTDIC